MLCKVTQAKPTDVTLCGSWAIVVSGHLKRLASIQNAFSTTCLALDSLLLKIQCWSLRFLPEKGFISKVLRAKTSLVTMKYGMSLSSPGIESASGKPMVPSILPQLAFVKDLGIRTAPITPQICPQKPVVNVHQS